MNAIGRRRKVLGQTVRTARARRQLATAMRTAAMQRSFRARPAEGPLERTDARVLGIGSDVRVTAFAVRSDFQHMSSLQSKQPNRTPAIHKPTPVNVIKA